MQWINIQTKTLKSPEYIGANPVKRATWLNLLSYSFDQENGGKIENSIHWSSRQWQQICGVTRREVKAETGLWHWEGDSLVVSFYPLHLEEAVKTKREAGKKGGRPKDNHEVNHMVSGSLTIDETKEKGNSKGKEKKDRGGPDLENHMVSENAVPVPFPAPDAPAKTPDQLRAEKLFHRRPTTPWAKAELTAWRASRAAIEGTHADDWELLEWFYAQPQGKTYARRDLATLLNNWTGEIDRARSYQAGKGSKLSPEYQNAF